MLALLLFLGVSSTASDPTVWKGTTVGDLHNEYGNIFKYGNRNAASHLWSSFVLQRSTTMTQDTFELMFSGFCPVSGSPVNPSEFNRYRFRLPLVTGGHRDGYLHFCCTPCLCDTQDFIKVDTKTVKTSEGLDREYHFAVVGNPCEKSGELTRSFIDPFSGSSTSLSKAAPEVRCDDHGGLIGATLSDNKHIIIGMFHDVDEPNNEPQPTLSDPTPGRLSSTPAGLQYSDEREWVNVCNDRAGNGYGSGMGLIFRKVATICPVPVAGAGAGAAAKPCLGDGCKEDTGSL